MRNLFKLLVVFTMSLSLMACGKKVVNEGLKDGTFTGSGKGNNGPISVEVSVKDKKIAGITLKEHAETKGLGDVAMDSIIKLIVENNSTNCDVVSGATNSSNGLIEAVRNGLIEAGATEEYFKNEKKIETVKTELEDEYTFDVVIVGAGGAGLSAAIEAANAGASVVVLEKTPAAGGNTLISGGGINAPQTKQQIAKNIEDSADLFYSDTLKGGDNKGDEALVRTLADNANSAAEWLVNDVKVEFLSDRVQQFGGHSVARALIPVGNKGVELINKMLAVTDKLGVQVMYDTQAESIETKDNKIVGVKAKNNGKEIMFNANKGVIIASGGFASNVEMRKQYNSNYDERFMSTATNSSTGDGIVMAQNVGADVVGMEYIQVYPTCNPLTGIISYVANSRFDGALLFNQEGKRFVNEMGRRDDISNAILDQSGSVGYLVWGQEIETVGNMTKMHEVEFENFKKDDLIYVADTLEDAAKHYNLDVETFVKTIEDYNKSIEDEKDEEFNKGGALRPIKEGPYYIQKVVPSAHHTMGGLKINTMAQVLDTKGNVIEGLYAAGEVTGGIHGTNRLGGNAITDIIVFGRIAGQNIVK